MTIRWKVIRSSDTESILGKAGRTRLFCRFDKNRIADIRDFVQYEKSDCQARGNYEPLLAGG